MRNFEIVLAKCITSELFYTMAHEAHLGRYCVMRWDMYV